ncbi:MAG: DUF4419 domain-containing protein [Sphingobacteriaceae bacterium]|nr:MAG: DUF4419 domain-containing protein [Sphingobacteriaceae bacterium]
MTAFCVFNDDGEWQGAKKEDEWRRIKKQEYPVVETNDIPCGIMTCPLLINDNGNEIKTVLVSGHGAFVETDKYTIQPSLGWSLFPKLPLS